MSDIFDLKAKFTPSGDQPQAIKALVNNFSEKNEQTLLGVTGSGKTFTFAHVIKNLGKKTLVLAHNKTLAAQLYSELKEFFPNNAVEYFVSYYDYYRPEAYVVNSDLYIEKDASINDDIDKLRHSATMSLLERDDVIVVASVSCIYGIGDPDDYKKQSIFLEEDLELDRDDFLKGLVSIQYNRNDIDLTRGNFRVRGDIVEIFPAYEDSKIIRVEFFGDIIDSISFVDPLLGKTLGKKTRLRIYPSSHYVVGARRLKKAQETIKIELRERLTELKNQNKLVEMQRLEQRTLLDLEMIEEMGFCSGIENYSRHLTGKPAGEAPPTLIDFFGEDFLIVIDESHMTIPQVRGMFKGDRARKMNLVDYGFRLPSALDNRPLNFSEFEKKLKSVLYVSATPGEYELKRTNGEFVEQIIRPTGLLDPNVEVRPSNNQVEDFLIEFKECIKSGKRALLTTLTKRLAEDLSQYYSTLGLKVKYLHSDIDTIDRVAMLKELREGKVELIVGINLLREGLDLPEVGLVGIMDADKEGFLRSTNSLIQTIGRAARNSEGRVLMYGQKTTKSMKVAIEETERRRTIQHNYNEKNSITPKTVYSKIKLGVMEIISDKKTKKIKNKSPVLLGPSEIDEEIKKLSKEMKSLAKKLEFEKAAVLRDKINDLKIKKLQF